MNDPVGMDDLDLTRTDDWREPEDTVSIDEPMDEPESVGDDAEDVLDYCREFGLHPVGVHHGYIVKYLGMPHGRCRDWLHHTVMRRVDNTADGFLPSSRIINPDYPLWHARSHRELCYGRHCSDDRCDFCGDYAWVNGLDPRVLTHDYAEIEGGFVVVVCGGCLSRLWSGPKTDRFGITWHYDGEHDGIVVTPEPAESVHLTPDYQSLPVYSAHGEEEE